MMTDSKTARSLLEAGLTEDESAAVDAITRNLFSLARLEQCSNCQQWYAVEQRHLCHTSLSVVPMNQLLRCSGQMHVWTDSAAWCQCGNASRIVIP